MQKNSSGDLQACLRHSAKRTNSSHFLGMVATLMFANSSSAEHKCKHLTRLRSVGAGCPSGPQFPLGLRSKLSTYHSQHITTTTPALTDSSRLGVPPSLASLGRPVFTINQQHRPVIQNLVGPRGRAKAASLPGLPFG